MINNLFIGQISYQTAIKYRGLGLIDSFAVDEWELRFGKPNGWRQVYYIYKEKAGNL